MLWIAVHLPLLSLETFASTLPGGAGAQPLALLNGQDIVAVNPAAQALGVQVGFKRATALTLSSALIFGQADPLRDAEALAAVVHAALAFTPMVTVQRPGRARPADDAAGDDTVLLEVQASLRYFGGLPKLLQRLETALRPLGHRLHLVSAATPLGAALLARIHVRLRCDDLAATVAALRRAPVWLLGPGRRHWEALQGMGLHTVDDLNRVPRDGLARRFGPVVLDELDRATGRQPDPRTAIALPPAFESRLELCARADTTEQLMHGAAVLLARLIVWLSAQHAFVRRFELAMDHEKRSRRDGGDTPTSVLTIALGEPSRDAGHLLTLLRERLAQLRLPAPTMDLRLRASDIARRPPPNAELFPTPANEQEGLLRLIERLQARLGPEQVLRLEPIDEHRPEKATGYLPADARPRSSRNAQPRDGLDPAMPSAPRPPPTRSRSPAKPSPPMPQLFLPASAGGARSLPAARLPVRPVWLMWRPEPLADRPVWAESGLQHWPLVDGQPLRLLSGPERIETGWWDAEAIERDYFIAEKPDGALVWIYRERMPACSSVPCGWFLQGRFG